MQCVKPRQTGTPALCQRGANEASRVIRDFAGGQLCLPQLSTRQPAGFGNPLPGVQDAFG